MPRQSRSLTLTPDHIARVHRAVEDTGPIAGTLLQTDADYAAWVEHMIRSHPAPQAPTLLFAYGSLIWKPDFEHVGESVGDAHGWHRSFCFHVPRFRGTPEQPGLMMAMDRGGRCRGVLYELLPQNLPAQLDRLFRREFTVKPQSNLPRWITVATKAGPRPALAFVMNRASPAYAGKLPLETVADILSRSCGHWGTGAEYLLNTVTQLEARGIRDRNLWTLQRLVAERIERHHAWPVLSDEGLSLRRRGDAPTPGS